MLSDTEHQRDDMQRRDSDVWLQIKSAEIQQRNATLTIVTTVVGLVLSGAWWIAVQAAKDQVHPINLRLSKVETKAEVTEKKLDKIELKIDKLLDLVLENRKK